MSKSNAAMPKEPPKKIATARRRYTSPAMRERRKRIIDIAHRILGEGGVTSLTIRRLSLEAEVAQRTIYRLFGDKDGVVSATVIDRMKEVRDHIARKGQIYSLDVVFKELDWMVSEMERDILYAKVVIGFVFASEPPLLEVRELTSVARSRFLGWHAIQNELGHVRQDLDIDLLAQDHVMREFIVYRRWALGQTTGKQCCLELRACFLQSAALLLTDAIREQYIEMLAQIQMRLRALSGPSTDVPDSPD